MIPEIILQIRHDAIRHDAIFFVMCCKFCGRPKNEQKLGTQHFEKSTSTTNDRKKTRFQITHVCLNRRDK